MSLHSYDEMTPIQRDAIKEAGSIGTAHAATALSQLLGHQVRMTVPDIHIRGYNEAISSTGDPEELVAGTLVELSGDIKGLMLYIQKKKLINTILGQTLGQTLNDIGQMEEMERSAIVEIGNIMISSYMNSISELTGVTVELSVPEITVNMLGAILSVPMVAMGYQTDKLMTIEGAFIYEGQNLESTLLMVPEVNSLNYLLEKLGVDNR